MIKEYTTLLSYTQVATRTTKEEPPTGTSNSKEDRKKRTKYKQSNFFTKQNPRRPRSNERYTYRPRSRSTSQDSQRRERPQSKSPRRKFNSKSREGTPSKENRLRRDSTQGRIKCNRCEGFGHIVMNCRTKDPSRLRNQQ